MKEESICTFSFMPMREISLPSLSMRRVRASANDQGQEVEVDRVWLSAPVSIKREWTSRYGLSRSWIAVQADLVSAST